jgi:uncharacterized protein YciI
MFIVELTYKVPNEQLDQYLSAHRTFLDKYYTAGKFIASGAKVPREGGIILAQAASKEEISMIITEDPFHQHELADYRIIEFVASKKANNIQDLIA